MEDAVEPCPPARRPNPPIGQVPNPSPGGCGLPADRYLDRDMTTSQNTKPARLYRSREDRVIAGIAGGLAKYLGIDPVLVRLGFVVLVIAGGSGILAYLVAWIVIPEEPPRSNGDWEESQTTRPVPASGKTRTVLGIALVVIGIGLLAEWAMPSLNDIFWPLAVVAAGAGLIFYGVKR